MRDFKEFLRAQGLGDRTISDYLSRCRRIEREMKIDLESETRTTELFVSLILRLRARYRVVNEFGNASGYTASQLSGAVKKYTEHRWGKKISSQYPSAHPARRRK